MKVKTQAQPAKEDGKGEVVAKSKSKNKSRQKVNVLSSLNSNDIWLSRFKDKKDEEGGGVPSRDPTTLILQNR